MQNFHVALGNKRTLLEKSLGKKRVYVPKLRKYFRHTLCRSYIHKYINIRNHAPPNDGEKSHKYLQTRYL